MKSAFKRPALLLILTLFSSIVLAQQYEIRGTIKNNGNEAIPFASIAVEESGRGTTTNVDGKFRLVLPKGECILLLSHVSHKKQRIPMNLLRDTSVSLIMMPADRVLQEVEVVEDRVQKDDPVESEQSGAVKMTQKEIEMIPSIAGENDIIKVVQLLPGVNKGIEGTGDFFVRGGDADQNLLLLDGATIYNTGHLFGFVSVFNPDIIGEANILRGAFPAYYGGRLSSILDVRTASTITDHTEGEGSVGLISSKLMVKTPIKKNKVGLMLSGRRTYIDQIINVASDDVSLPYYFYDLNGRADYQIDDANNIYFSSYFGADVLKFSATPEGRSDGASFNSNNNIYNNSQTLGWQRRMKGNNKLNVEAHRSVFQYDILNSFVNEKIKASSGIEDYGLNVSVQNSLNDKTMLYYGLLGISHEVQPIEFESDGIISDFIPSSRSEGNQILETGLYGEVAYDLSPLTRVRLGYRQSFGIVSNSIYPGYEPRVAVRHKLNENAALKLSYSRMNQYLHRVSSSSLTLPVDLWYTITDDIKPQSSDQVTIGYAYKHPKTDISLETDLYYKQMKNLTEYEPGTRLLFNAEFEDALLQGNGESYGWEVLLRKDGEKLFGWISYSLGWSYRQFDGLNEGQRYNATYDRRHNAAIVLQYNIWRRWAVSGVWEYISGSRFTPVIGQYAVTNPTNTGVDVVNIYSDRNAVTLSNSHRLDLMIILKSKQKRRFQGEWRAGVYNVYNRATPVQTYVTIADDGSYQYVQPGLFGALPFVSYFFKF